MMRRRNLLSRAILFFALGVLPVRSQHPAAPRNEIAGKIAPWVLDRTAGGGQAEFLILMAEHADLSPSRTMEARQEKARFVRETLLAKARRTQEPVLQWLRERRIPHRAFYIVNTIWVKADRATVLALAERPEILRVDGNPRIQNVVPAPEASAGATTTAAGVESGIASIRAPEVWAMGFTGQDIVIGSQDTGVQWDHPALKARYRGWDGSSASHDYNWHDSIHSGGGVCGPDSPHPCDDSNHGTHTVGTALGDDLAGNQIGAAPGARFMACRNMDRGVGTPASYLECFEFFLAPYPIGASPLQGDPSRAPDVTINSWSCPPSEGCAPETLRLALEAQRAAGIMTVVSAGNTGPSCSTASNPPAIYEGSYSVGAFDPATGEIAGFSSRGPVIIDGSNRLKPDIAAPGVRIRSSIRDGAYGIFSGTSMAAPHVAGAVALLWSARPELRHRLELTEAILNEPAVKVDAAACGGEGAANNVYGHGRLDIKAAVDLASLRSLTSVSTASYGRSAIAPESIVSAFGSNLAEIDAVPGAGTLPLALGGTTVKVRDSAKVERIAPLFFVSSKQVNYMMPPETAGGSATIMITSGNGSVSTGIASIAPVAPGLFSANFNGQGVAAAVALRIRADGSRSVEDVARFDPSQGRAVPVPIGLESDQIFLLLYGTGIRLRSSLDAVTVTIGGERAEVTFAGAAPGYPGLDQVNVLLPRSLIGRGEVEVNLTADGKAANTVTVHIK